MNFLYTPNRAWVLAQRLRRTGALDHPVAVLFKNGPIRPGKSGWSFLEDRIPVPKGHDVKDEKLFVGGDPRALAAALPNDVQHPPSEFNRDLLHRVRRVDAVTPKPTFSWSSEPQAR